MSTGTQLIVRSVRDEPPALEPLTLGSHVFDVEDDLVDYTGLKRSIVAAMIGRRPENFRSEWHTLPPQLKSDRWFYLASRTYLFANARHAHEDPALIDRLDRLAAKGHPMLDFGGGAGNVALALAASGHDVDYVELSALQKDFTRFRVAKHGLGARIRLLDEWEDLPASRYGVVCAIDVLEHVPDLEPGLDRLIQSLIPGGALFENTSFGSTAQNPMHHEDHLGLIDFLARQLRLEHEQGGSRTWRRD